MAIPSSCISQKSLLGLPMGCLLSKRSQQPLHKLPFSTSLHQMAHPSWLPLMQGRYFLRALKAICKLLGTTLSEWNHFSKALTRLSVSPWETLEASWYCSVALYLHSMGGRHPTLSAQTLFVPLLPKGIASPYPST